MIRDLVISNRSYRRFDADRTIEQTVLRELVDLARMSASAANLQPLKYVISSTESVNAEIFPMLAWAGYLSDWKGPNEQERPTAYIVILLDTEISASCDCDHGIAAQSILLGAAEKGIGGCIVGSIQRDKLRELLSIGERFEILLVLAMGYPAEEVVLEDTITSGEIKYYRDSQDVHHVPKRPLKEVIL